MKEKLPTPDKIKEEKERIKEEVQAFKERTEGLNPDMFAVPGEGSLEEENIPEEMILAYELEEKIAEYTKKARLVKNKALKIIEIYFDQGRTDPISARRAIHGLSSLLHSPLWSEINKGKQEKLVRKTKLAKANTLRKVESDLDDSQTDPWSAWRAICGLSSLINSPLWPEIDKEKQKELIEKIRLAKDNVLKKIESNLNNSQTNSNNAWNAIFSLSALINSPLWPEISEERQEELIEKAWLVKDNALEEIESDLNKSQTNQESARLAILGLSSLITLKDYLVETANQKLKEQEHQKALHPEKEIPPRPEFSSF